MEDDKRLEKLKETINNLAYTEKQKVEALKQLSDIEPRIRKVISTMVYNRDFGREISVLTSPDLNLKFKFYKR